jgi:hypothetical protein
MAAGKSMRRQVGALMISSVVAIGVSVISSTAKAEDDASRFTYVRLHCTPDNQSHFQDVTIELAQENFAPPAAPIAIGETRQLHAGDMVLLEDITPCRGHTVVGDKPGFLLFAR